MRFLTLLISIITLCLLQGCASNRTKQSAVPAINYQLPHRSAAQLEKKFEVYAKSPNKADFQFIEAGYLGILKISPDYLPAMRGLYGIYYFESQSEVGVISERGLTDNKLSQLYWRLPSLVRQEYYPPAFAQYQRNVALMQSRVKMVSDARQLQQLLQAVGQSPQNPTIRVILAEQLLAMKQEQVGIALIKEAWAAQPSEDIYPHALGNLQYRTALSNECAQDHPDILAPALNYYRKALTLNPDANVHYEMGVIYGLLMLKPLMINEANLLANKNDLNSYWQSGYLYIHAEQLGKAKEVFQKANQIADLKEFPQSRAYIDFLMLNKDWGKAADYYRRYLTYKQSLTSYDLLISSLIWTQLAEQKSKLSLEDVWPANRKVSERYGWPDQLMELMFSDKMVGDKDDELGANNFQQTRCNQVQLSFYAGLKDIADNNVQQAKIHAAKIKEANLPFSLESLLSKQLL